MYSYAKRKNVNVVRLILAGVVVLIIFLSLRNWRTEASGLVSPLAGDASPKANLTDFFVQKKPKSNAELITGLKDYISKQNGVYSIYFYDLQTNTGFGINETTIFTAASVNKLPVLATLYHLADTNKLDLDERVTLQAKDIQDFGTGTLRYEGPGGVYSLKTLAQLLIEKSDNTAAYVLTQRLGETTIQKMTDGWGLTQTDISMNKTTSKDISMLLVKMYQKQIASDALTQEMIGFMDDSDFENRLPALLPEGVKVYHKIGNEVGNIHDVGIIMHPKRPYILAVMTNDIINEHEAETAIAQISKYTYDFVSQE